MTVKRCYACEKDKDVNDFSENKSRPDGRNSMCKSCKKDYNANYYARTKNVHNPARAIRRDGLKREARRNLVAYLLLHSCVDCGESDIVTLQFDHQGDKVMDVSDMISNGCTWERILAEIAKCEVVCANDHMRRTAKTRSWHKLTARPSLVGSTG